MSFLCYYTYTYFKKADRDFGSDMQVNHTVLSFISFVLMKASININMDGENVIYYNL